MMRTQKCSKCGTLLDVSKLEKGTKFACSTCGAVLVVGEATAVKRSLQSSGPAYVPRTGKESAAPAPSRRPAPARRTPKTGEAPHRARRAPASETSGKSSKVVWIAIGAVVLVGVIVGIVLTQGGTAGGGGSSSASVEPGANAKTPQEWWTAVNGSLDRSDPAKIHKALAQAKSRGFDKDVAFWAPLEKSLYESLHRADPEDADANHYFGRHSILELPDFRKRWTQIVDNYRAVPASVSKFFDEYEQKLLDRNGKLRNVWLGPAEYAKVKKAYDEFVAWETQREKNPLIALVKQKLASASAGPVLQKYGTVVSTAAPFAVVVGSTDLKASSSKPADQEQASAKKADLQKRADHYAALLKAFVADFEKRYSPVLGSPLFKKDDALYVWVFDDSDGYQEMRRNSRGFFEPEKLPLLDNKNVEPAHQFHLFFSPVTRWGFVGPGDEKGAAQKLDGDLLHLAVHMMEWELSRDPKNPRFHYYWDEFHARWFVEGWAQYLAGGAKVTGDSLVLGGPDPWCLDGLSGSIQNVVPLYPLREFVQQDTYQGYRRWYEGSWLQNLKLRDDLPDSALDYPDTQGLNYEENSFYWQSWALLSFLAEGEGGKYAPALNDFVKAAEDGRKKTAKYGGSGDDRWDSAYDAFCDIFKIHSDADWNRLQKEYESYVEKKAK